MNHFSLSGDQLIRESLPLSPGTPSASSRAQVPSPASSDADRVRVAARFRPLSEAANGTSSSNCCVAFHEDGRSCTLEVGKTYGTRQLDFHYDAVFKPGTSQEEVYLHMAQPIVQGVLSGINGAVIAYGQTGSGKTHTMLGPAGARSLVEGRVAEEELGIIPRALRELHEAAVRSGNVAMKVSYVEIYQEHVHDLLSPCIKPAWEGGGPTSHSIRLRGGDLWLPQVTETPVTSPQEALEVMRQGNRNRSTAATEMNKDSSRSHAIFIVTVTNVEEMQQLYAQLYLVDLAGSERVDRTEVTGQQLEEAKLINKSLLALGQVIWSLAHKSQHVPYRDSKLTRLLQNCLGGNARTAVIVTASPHCDNASESLSTLRFADRAAMIRNEARVNMADNPEELKRLLAQARQELEDLRSRCSQLEVEAASLREVQRMAPFCGVGAESQNTTAASEVTPLERLAERRMLVWNLLPMLICPVSRRVMREAVVAVDGWSYERSAIEKHFANAGRSLPTSPVTGKRLTSRVLTPNLLVRQLVQAHFADLPGLPGHTSPLDSLHTWLVQVILEFLDPRSLALCEAAWPYFLAASSCKSLWAKFLAQDFPRDAEACSNDAVDRWPRARYSALMLTLRVQAKVKLAPTISRGLLLPARS